VLTLSDRAKEVVHSYLDQSGGELSALRITMVGSPVAPQFELTLVGPTERRDEEKDLAIDGLTVLIDEAQVETLDGANVDFVERVNESGFEVKLAPGAGRKSVPSGPLAERVKEVLDSQINPAIASHGGAIDLIDVQGTEIYFEMTGGCQGCAMSRMTLRQGVERMVRQAVPEITVIHDVTDHSSGDNPFFEGPRV
jgi:Fe/S biogenesis protein NfuA